MSITLKTLKALIYLWTRDSNLPINDDTEAYILQHLQALKNYPKYLYQFSDEKREDMSDRIIKSMNKNIGGKQ